MNGDTSAAATTAPREVDPDVRFLLANERTLLAWVRTGVALQAGGVAVLQFVTTVEAHGVIGLGLLLLGAFAGLTGFRRYRMADRAIRRQELPDRGKAPELMTLALVALSAALAAGYLVAELT